MPRELREKWEYEVFEVAKQSEVTGGKEGDVDGGKEGDADNGKESDADDGEQPTDIRGGGVGDDELEEEEPEVPCRLDCTTTASKASNWIEAPTGPISSL